MLATNLTVWGVGYVLLLSVVLVVGGSKRIGQSGWTLQAWISRQPAAVQWMIAMLLFAIGPTGLCLLAGLGIRPSLIIGALGGLGFGVVGVSVKSWQGRRLRRGRNSHPPTDHPA